MAKAKRHEVDAGSSPSAAASPLSIRRDIWLAFTLVDAKKSVRVYDKVTDLAHLLPERPLELESSDRFVLIEPINSETQKEWAAAFASELENPLAEEFRQVLTEDRWFNKFHKHLEEHGLARDWDVRRSHRVLESIEAWKKNNNLKVDVGGSVQSDQTRFRPNRESIRIETIRARVLDAIKQMPLHELLALEIRVSYLL